MVDNPKNPQSINIELNEKVAEGIYANFVIASHSPSEFVIDFARIMPGLPKGKVHARILMTPQHAKSLEKTIHDNIAKYEKSFGPISMPTKKDGPGDYFKFDLPGSSN